VWTPPIAPWDVPAQDRLDRVAGADFVVDVSRWRERRIAALRAHGTQHLSIDRCFFNRADVHDILDREVWRHAFGPPLRRRPCADLLDGLPVERRSAD
jgi:hypothetical protein